MKKKSKKYAFSNTYLILKEKHSYFLAGNMLTQKKHNTRKL